MADQINRRVAVLTDRPSKLIHDELVNVLDNRLVFH